MVSQVVWTSSSYLYSPAYMLSTRIAGFVDVTVSLLYLDGFEKPNLSCYCCPSDVYFNSGELD